MAEAFTLSLILVVPVQVDDFSHVFCLGCVFSYMELHALETHLVDMVGIAQVLVLNIGTLDSYWIDGVPLGRSDMPVTQARRLLPPDVFIGWPPVSD